MGRLIDADSLKKAIGGESWKYHVSSVRLSIEYINMIIDEQPSVEVKEERHGHWSPLTDCSNAGVYCSVCHKKVWKEDYAWCNRKNKLRSNYCPNCGAKMDGGE